MTQLETEWTVVGDAKSWMDQLLAAHGTSAPFSAIKLETKAQGSLKRRDLTVLDRARGVCLTGEVKVPWAHDGASPFVETTVLDARQKAEMAGSLWFFTWNLNELVLWRTDSVAGLGQSRHFKTYTTGSMTRASELDNPRHRDAMRNGIEIFFNDFLKIFIGEREVPRRAPDEYFVHAFDSFLSWPVLAARHALIRRDAEAGSRAAVDRWMREDQGWTLVGDRAELLGRAAKFASYAVANKLVFYDALRKRYADLPILEVAATDVTGEAVVERFATYFDQARFVTGDYETVFGTAVGDVGSRLPFYDDAVVDAWRQFVQQLERFDLSRLDYDVIGKIFERLIDPEERHKYGQYYTRPEVVDLINAFTIRSGTDIVLDPGCGGGTFLVRAYARKRRLAPRLGHRALLETIYGTDVSPFAAHLSTINLATRDLVEEANYPRIKRTDFFELRGGGEFMQLPAGPGIARIPVPRFDAIVGNPPYVRQEELTTGQKAKYLAVARSGGLVPTGRSDLHVYFWGQALALMAPAARLGFLASSQWLDADYGFPLQAWLLENFRIEAIVESRDEPWFVGARVATVATLAVRESDPEARDDNLIRFVEIRRPIAELLAHDDTTAGALEAAERLRDTIMACAVDTAGDGWRLRVVRQGDLRQAGVTLGERTRGRSEYAGGKWGIPLRAPDVWADLLAAGGTRWRALAEIADVARGITSGCDDFFYVANHSARGLADLAEAAAFERHFGAPRADVASGRIILARAGTGEVFPIEAEYLQPIVHSLMGIDSYQVELRHCAKLALMVDSDRTVLAGRLVDRYIAWGERQGFNGGATCLARGRSKQWYNILDDVVAADVLWVKERQYRFAALANPAHLVANCRLYTIKFQEDVDAEVQSAILNSTLVVLSTLMFGRPVGVEANWSTMVLDTNMLMVPSANATPAIRERILAAHSRLSSRAILGFLSDRRLRHRSLTERGRAAELAFLSDQTELDQPDRHDLDDAVLELLGVTDRQERARLRDALYAHLRSHFEALRVKEEEAQDNRRVTANAGTLGADQVSDDVYAEIERDHPRLLQTYSEMTAGSAAGDGIRIPASGSPVVVDDLASRGVRFGEVRGGVMVNAKTRVQAELIAAIATVGPRGRSLFVPFDDATAQPLVARLNGLAVERLEVVDRLVRDRTVDPGLVERASAKVIARLVAGIPRPRRVTALSAPA